MFPQGRAYTRALKSEVISLLFPVGVCVCVGGGGGQQLQMTGL